MDPGRAYARRDCAGVKLRWTWRNGRLATNPKVVDLRVAGWSVCLAVPKNGEPEGGGVVPKQEDLKKFPVSHHRRSV